MTVLVFTDHTDCPVCDGKERVKVGIVRRRTASGPMVADPVGSVITCPLMPRLPLLFPSVSGGGPRATA